MFSEVFTMRTWHLLLVVLLTSCAEAVRADDAAEAFKKIKPIFERKCFECHSSKAEELKGNLKLESVEDILRGGDSGPAVKPGDPAESLLARPIRYEIEDKQMPPSGKLDDADVRLIEEWIKQLLAK
jgi:mono/diheme cytochrome c family protein